MASPSRSGPVWVMGRILDVPLAMLFMSLLLLPLLCLRLFRRRPAGGERLLLVHYGGDVKSTLEKYGSLAMFTGFNPDGFFERVVVLDYPSLNPGETRVDDRTLVIDRGVPGPFYLVSAVLTLALVARLAIQERITCVRVGELPHLIPFAWMAGWIQGCPVVMSIHSDWEAGWHDAPDAYQLYGGPAVRRLMERLAYPLVDEAWPVFGPWRVVATRRGVPAERVRLFPHGIDLAPFRFPPFADFLCRVGKQEGRAAVAWAGRFSTDTYAHHLPGIIGQVKAMGEKPLFLLAGGGEGESALRDAIRGKGLEEDVRFLGYLPREEVPWLASLADVNLSLFGGKTTYEMMASGKVLVAYGVGWNREELKDGVNALVAPVGDERACAERIVWALRHAEEAARIGATAREWIFEHHDDERVQARKAGMYRDLLVRRRAS